MSNVSDLFRSLVIYGICLPLAVWLGYSLANGIDLMSASVIGIIVVVLLIPLFLRWHHPWLIAAWNMNAVAFFLPGRPRVGMVMCLVSLGIAVLHYILERRHKFINVPSITRPLLALAIIVIVTARVTGGLGMRVLGSDNYGGRRYLDLLVGILGYFALVSQQIPPKRANLYIALFFLGAITAAVGSIAPLVTPAFYFLLLPFPLENPLLQSSVSETTASYTRLGSLSSATAAIYIFMLAHYGIKEIFTMNKWWRFPLFIGVVAITMMGGFRSMLIVFILLFGIMFYLEGLMKTRMMPVMLLCVVLGGALLIPFVNHLPLAMQRALSIFPLPVDPVTKADAMNSTQWRLKMWQDLLPEIPKYLLVGKGYSFNAAEMAMMRENLGIAENAPGAMLAGDFHNGALSIIIPYGIGGMIAFIWFVIASLRALYQNYKFGAPEYRKINCFLFAYFLTRALMFFFGAGALYSEMITFTGLIGLSISLNGGVAKPVVVPQPKIVFNRFRLHPGVREPVQAQ